MREEAEGCLRAWRLSSHISLARPEMRIGDDCAKHPSSGHASMRKCASMTDSRPIRLFWSLVTRVTASAFFSTCTVFLHRPRAPPQPSPPKSPTFYFPPFQRNPSSRHLPARRSFKAHLSNTAQWAQSANNAVVHANPKRRTKAFRLTRDYIPMPLRGHTQRGKSD